MTTVYFGGAETPTHRRRLLAAGARALSVGMLDLMPRVGEAEWSLHSVLPDRRVLLDLQGGAATKRELSDEAAGQYVESALRLVYDNRDAMDGVVEFDYRPWGLEGVLAGRSQFFDHLPVEKFLPVWHPEWEEFGALAERYARVAIPRDVLTQLDEADIKRLRGEALRSNVSLHGLGTTNQKLAKSLRLASISSSSWTAATAHGETALWERNRVRRYRAEDKEHLRTRKRSIIEAMGVDPDLVTDDDPQALVTLQVSAWQSWGDHTDVTSRGVTGTPPPTSTRNLPQPSESTPVTPTRFQWNGEAPEGTKLLPLLATEQNPQTGGFELSTTPRSLRRCSTCALAGMCPEYTDDATDDWCRVAIPIEVRDKAQLSALLRTFVELQAQRAMFAKFTEDMEGVGSSAETSREFDRLMAMTESMKRVMEDTTFLRVTVEANSSSSGGVLSALFGVDAGDTARQVEPEQAEQVMAEVLEG